MKNRSALGLFSTATLIVAGVLAQPYAAGQQPVTPTQTPAAPASPPAADTDDKLTFEGDTAFWTVAIKPDKTADFEQIMMKLRHALMNSDDPQRQRQAAGWKVVRLATPLPGGNVGYLHLLQPVVPGADYSVMRTLYDELPDERQALYEQYRGAFAGNIALAVGNVAIDLGAQAPASPVAPAGPPAHPPAAHPPTTHPPAVHPPTAHPPPTTTPPVNPVAPPVPR